jgi:hypothetical protein
MMGSAHGGRQGLRRDSGGLSLEEHVPAPLRRVDRVLDLAAVRAPLAPCDSRLGRPAVDSKPKTRRSAVCHAWTVAPSARHSTSSLPGPDAVASTRTPVPDATRTKLPQGSSHSSNVRLPELTIRIGVDFIAR